MLRLSIDISKAVKEDNFLSEVAEELTAVFGKRKERIYQTNVPADFDVVFITTSKDVHLAFGLMSSHCQFRLANFLADKFGGRSGKDDAELDEPDKYTQIVLVFGLWSILVTKTSFSNGKGWAFTFDPLNN